MVKGGLKECSSFCNLPWLAIITMGFPMAFILQRDRLLVEYCFGCLSSMIGFSMNSLLFYPPCLKSLKNILRARFSYREFVYYTGIYFVLKIVISFLHRDNTTQ
jgi:hypothetical protein